MNGDRKSLACAADVLCPEFESPPFAVVFQCAPESAKILRRMSFYISTLLYCFNERDEVLLLERAQEPNLGLWSPCGGKLMVETGESPYACACREAWEEMSLTLKPSDLHLAGMVSERGTSGEAHWLMFLFEVKPRLTILPVPHREGRFAFFPVSTIQNLALPQTDKEQIWRLFWQHRGGFFAAHCSKMPDGSYDWVIEESIPGIRAP
jgi:8-oxo-dGTP diphosphatase